MKMVRIAFALAVALFIAHGPYVSAQPMSEYEVTYFSDASHTTVVGFLGEYCNYRTWWGHSSRYYSVEFFSDCDLGGDDPPNQCIDGLDNDGDGSTDSLDSNCSFAGSVVE